MDKEARERLKDNKGNPAIGVRVSLQEQAAWRAAAENDGFNSLPSWLRQFARNRVEEIKTDSAA